MMKAALKAYQTRLKDIRAELVAISEDLKPLTTKPAEDLADHVKGTLAAMATMAQSVRGLCGILVRVIDSLGG